MVYTESEESDYYQQPKKKTTKKIQKKAPAKGKAKGKAAASKSKGKTTKKPAANSKSRTTTAASKKRKNSDADDFLPEQKYETPPEKDSCRVFYQTLYQQNENSFIAQKYCLERGLIPEEDINKVKKNVMKQKGKK